MTSRHTPKLREHSGMSSGGRPPRSLEVCGDVSDELQKPPTEAKPLRRHAENAGNEMPASIQSWK